VNRYLIVGFICVAAVPTCVLAWVHARGSWAREQLATPTTALWPGYEILVGQARDSGGQVYSVRVEQHGEQVFERRFAVRTALSGGEPRGFFAPLNVDSDPDLEIVHCDDGVVQAYIEPGWRKVGVVQHPGIHAGPLARDVCAAYVEAIDWNVNIFCCFMGSVGFVFLFAGLRRRDDDLVSRGAPKSF
jgi:hypothetical protein